MASRDSIRFWFRGELQVIDDFAPTETLLDFLRLRRSACGTKEGCAEGDCGACTVTVIRSVAGEVRIEAVNACIQFLGTLDGCVLLTVEDLEDEHGTLHPVQSAMIKHHGSQCGFCTPGIVMSLFAQSTSPTQVSRGELEDCLAGNLCRCTGYKPIMEAGLESCNGASADLSGYFSQVDEISELDDLFTGNDESFFAAPANKETLLDLIAQHPDATLFSGATDVGLWHTKLFKKLPKLIYLGKVAELLSIEDDESELKLGAAVSYERAAQFLGAIDKDIAELLRRLGSTQVRNAGTIGGNIANGSPIGDSPPVLIALGASIILESKGGRRSVLLEDFFIEYGKQDRRADEVLTEIIVPKLKADQRFSCFKLAKRYDQDISSVMAAFCFSLDGAKITEAKLAYGGMAGTPKRAVNTEAALIGQDVEEALAHVMTLETDFAPLDDHRASAEYRMVTAQNLLKKALLELSDIEKQRTRLLPKEAAHV